MTVAPPAARLHLVPALLSAALVCVLLACPAIGKQPGQAPPGQAKKAAQAPPPGQAKKAAKAPSPGQAKKAAKAGAPAPTTNAAKAQPPGQAKKAAGGLPPGQAKKAAGAAPTGQANTHQRCSGARAGEEVLRSRRPPRRARSRRRPA